MEKTRISKMFDSAWNISWFAMDICWMNGWMNPAYCFMAVCMLIMLSLFPLTMEDLKSKLPFFATASWNMMNIFWMLGEQKVVAAREWSLLMMSTGIVSLVMMAVFDKSLIAYFRRFRG